MPITQMDYFHYFAVLCILFFTCISVDGYKRVCYFTNWSQNRAPRARLFPEQVGQGPVYYRVLQPNCRMLLSFGMKAIKSTIKIFISSESAFVTVFLLAV